MRAYGSTLRLKLENELQVKSQLLHESVTHTPPSPLPATSLHAQPSLQLDKGWLPHHAEAHTLISAAGVSALARGLRDHDDAYSASTHAIFEALISVAREIKHQQLELQDAKPPTAGSTGDDAGDAGDAGVLPGPGTSKGFRFDGITASLAAAKLKKKVEIKHAHEKKVAPLVYCNLHGTFGLASGDSAWSEHLTPEAAIGTTFTATDIVSATASKDCFCDKQGGGYAVPQLQQGQVVLVTVDSPIVCFVSRPTVVSEDGERYNQQGEVTKVWASGHSLIQTSPFSYDLPPLSTIVLEKRVEPGRWSAYGTVIHQHLYIVSVSYPIDSSDDSSIRQVDSSMGAMKPPPLQMHQLVNLLKADPGTHDLTVEIDACYAKFASGEWLRSEFLIELKRIVGRYRIYRILEDPVGAIRRKNLRLASEGSQKRLKDKLKTVSRSTHHLQGINSAKAEQDVPLPPKELPTAVAACGMAAATACGVAANVYAAAASPPAICSMLGGRLKEQWEALVEWVAGDYDVYRQQIRLGPLLEE